MRRQAVHLLVVTVLALSAVLPARALQPGKAVTQYGHFVWQTDAGLPSNAVQAILQTRDGYLWLGTQEGLARFDGTRFVVFDKRNTPALGHNSVRALLQDREGALWIGTNGGGLTRMKDGEFTAYGHEQGLPALQVWCLLEDRSGTLWAGTIGGGLARFEHGRFIALGKGQGLSDDSVLCLSQDGEGNLWAGTRGGGLDRITPARGGPPAVTSWTTADGLPSNRIWAVLHEGPGDLWIGTEGGGLCRMALRGGRATFQRMGREGEPPGDVAYALLKDRGGTLWIGTRGVGLVRFTGGRFEPYGTREGFSGNQVYSLCEDREGSLWVGTIGGGVNRLSDGSVSSFGVREGLSSDMAYTLCEGPDGTLWVGTDGGGLNGIRGGEVTHFGTGNGLSCDRVFSLLAGPAGVLWVGTFGGGLERLEGGRITHLGPAQGLTSAFIYSLAQGPDGTLWVGTSGGGLFHSEGGRFAALTARDGLAHDNVRALLVARDGVVWAGTDAGLSRLERAGSTWHMESYRSSDGLPGNQIYALMEERPGVLWIGTNGSGVARVKIPEALPGSRPKISVDSFTAAQGLPDEATFAILSDGLGSLWFSSNRGIFRIALSDFERVAGGAAKQLRPTLFGAADGMRSAECNGSVQPAGVRTRDGRLCFPTVRGVATLRPDQILVNKLPPPVLVEEVLLNGEPVDVRAGVTLDPGANHLEIRYTGLSYLAPSKVLFRYQLVGFEDRWVEAGTRRTAYYTSLPPGSYTFRVMACNNDGIWNETGAGFALVQRAHVYETAWFNGLLFVLLVSVGLAAYILRGRQLRARQAQLERVVAERTAQLQVANERLERLSAQDGLTGLANRRSFDEHMERLWRQLARSREPLALVMMDLDAFKPFNDTYGHQKGDECLVAVASVLQGAAGRAGDLAARYGGEEFALILSATDAEGAHGIAEKIRAAVEAMAIAHAASPAAPVVTVSAGVASLVPSDTSQASGLIGSADQALYLAKQEGRNRVCSFTGAAKRT